MRGFLAVFLFSNLVYAACPAPGPTTTAAGTFGDMCGNSTTGGPLNKACCISAGVTTGIFWIHNGGAPIVRRIESSCALDVMLPGNLAAEWIAFQANRPSCLTLIPSFTWIGLADANWSTPANWSTGIAPGAGDVAIFDDNCQANCSAVTLDGNINVAGVLVENTFPASTFTAGAVSIAIGASGWIQRSAAGLIMNGAAATSITGPLQITTGAFNVSTTSNSLTNLTISGGALSGGANPVTVSGMVIMTSGSYASTTGTNIFSGSVYKSGGAITSGSVLTVLGTASNSSGPWTLTSGGMSTFGTGSVVSVTGGVMAVPDVAGSAANFAGTLDIAGSGQVTVGAAGAVTVAGLLTVSSTTPNAYHSAGTDNINGGVILSAAGGISTGKALTENGLVSISTGTWALGQGVHVFNDDGNDTVTMTGGLILPMGTVTFDSAGTSLVMTAGTFGAAGSLGQVNFTSGVYLDPTDGNVDYNNGLTTVAVGGVLTMRENGGSTNTVVFGDGLAATNTFGGITMVREAAGGSHPNPQFVHGATSITTGTFSLTSDSAAIGANRGAIFGNAAGNNGGTGPFTVTGAFTFNCGTRADGNRFYAPSNTTDFQGSVSVVNNGCNVGAGQFDMDTGTTTMRLSGGNQTLTNTNPFATNTLVVGYTGNGQHKAIGSAAQTITTGTLTVNDSGFTGVTLALGAPVTISGTGVPLRFNSTGSMTITTTGAVAAASGSLVADSWAGALTVNNNGNITMGGTAAGAVTLNMNSPGTIVLNGPGTLIANSHINVNDSGGNLSGTMPITMQGNTTSNLTIAGTGVLGTSGTFTVNKTNATDILAVNSLSLYINQASQPFTITRGTVRVQPAAGTCSGTPCALNMAAFTIGANGSLVCGIGSFSADSVTIVNGGSINCAGYGYNWTGAGGSANWSVPGNWSGAAVPGFNDTAVFNPVYCGSGALCNATINTDQTLYGVHLMTGYPGTITQAANLYMGQGGWRHEAGTFTGGAFAFSTTGSFSKTGGTFTPPSGTTTFHALNAQNLTFTSPAGTFTGPVLISGSGATYTVTGTATISGLLTLAGTGTSTMNTGFIHATGNVHLDNNGIRGTTVLRFNGTGAQTLTANTTTNYFPAVAITNPTGPVTFTSGDTFLFSNNYTHANTATIATTGATLSFAPTVTPVTLTFRPDFYENLFISPTLAATVNVAGTANVSGVLVYGPAAATTCTGGAVQHWGTVNPTIKFNSTFGCQGTHNLVVAGTADRTITNAGAAMIPTFTVLASGGTVTYASGSILRFANNYSYLGTAGLTSTGSTVRFTVNSQTITPGAATVYNNVDMNPGAVNTITLNDTMTMQGTLNMGNTGGGSPCAFTRGTGAGVLAQNGMVTNFTGNNTTRGCAGTGIVRLAGGVAGPAQTIFNASSGRIPSFEVTANSPNRVVFGNNTTYSFRNSYAWTGSAAITPNTSTAQWAAAAANGISPGTVRYYRINFDNAGPFTVTGTAMAYDRITFGGTAGGTINGGTLELVGTGAAVTQMIFSHAFNGTTNLSFTGTGNQATVTTSAGATFDNLTGSLTVDKLGRSVIYLNDVDFNDSKNVSLNSGTLRFNGTVNTASAASTWTGQAGTRFEGTATETIDIGNLILNGGTFDKNTATVTIRSAVVPCTNGVLANGNPICGGIVSD